MAQATRVTWHIAGEEIATCNCAWGCPCQFNALPTHGGCEALVAYQIREGAFGDTRLDGVRWAGIFQWPGPIHQGNGTRQVIVDERATRTQREAILALESGAHGHARFEIFAAVCSKALEPAFLPIEFEVDRERRRARVTVGGLGEIRAEPIKNPVTGEEHRARIDLPAGFEYRLAEMGNTALLRVRSGPVAFEHRGTYAQFNAFDWDSSGAVR